MEEEKQETKEKVKFSKKFTDFHDKNYKLLLLIPIALLLFSFIYTGIFYSQNQDFIRKDISLTGGTVITLYSDVNPDQIKQDLSEQLDEIDTRRIYDLITGKQKAVIIETKTEGTPAKQILEDYLGYELTDENSSFEFTGSVLSENFYRQLLIAILFAFIFMSIVVFIIFRSIIPSVAVITSAFADIFMTLTLVNLLGIKMSAAGIIAFLMLIGYSVDTDILLTTRMLKRKEDPLNQRISKAFKTGITMTLTSLLAIIFALIIIKSFSQVITQIFTVLAIGLGFDILNTWITNVSILKWYIKKKER
jgi:preprotein translocase subunit SecF